METKKITCWFNWQEWKSVIDDAYNEDQDHNLINRAFSTILAWEARDSNLPSALIGLKELLSAKLAQIDINNSTIQQIYAYQCCLAMNIVRFVNFITEPYQTKLYAKSVKSIAASMGLPDWIVNLRHNATHFSLPSIELLESAREYLFSWLKIRYVDVYSEVALEKSILYNAKVYIEDIFIDYINVRYKSTLTKDKPDKSEIEEVENKIQVLVNHFRNETFEILLQDGFMVPTKDQLNAVGILAEEFIENDQLLIPKAFLNIWMSFLEYCNNTNSLIRILFQKLIQTYKTEYGHGTDLNIESIRNKFLLGWILTLVKLNSFKNEKKNCKFYFEMNFKETLESVLIGKPNRFYIQFLKEARKIPSFLNEIGQVKFEKLFNFVNLIDLHLNDFDRLTNDQCIESNEESQSFSMDLNESEQFYDLDLFEEKNKSNYNQYSNKNYQQQASNFNNSNSNWKLVGKNNYEPNWNFDNYKLGLAEGQLYEDLNLKMKDIFGHSEQRSHDLSTSLNQSLNQSYNAAKLNDLHSIFVSDNLNEKYLEAVKRDIFKNYWETS